MAPRKRPDFTRDFAAPPSAYQAEAAAVVAPRKRAEQPRKAELAAIAGTAYRRDDGAVMVPAGEGRSVNRASLRRLEREDEA